MTLSNFYIGETEVTQELWEEVMGSNPSLFTPNGSKKRPVESVSWDDCQEFIRRLNQLTGKNFRLPTEAEWEFAARGGIKSRHTKYSGGASLDAVAWCFENAYDIGKSSPDYGSHPVAKKAPNELGLYDMSGNVWEWCYDWYGDYTPSSQSNSKGPSQGFYRVTRGGSWNCNARNCRVSRRYGGSPVFRTIYVGLRLAL